MARKKVKMLDPAWQAERRKDRHRFKAFVRVEPEEKAQWQAWADQRQMTLSDWVIAACRAFGKERDQ